MGIQNLELSKLLSPKPGMDLKKGVPGKEEKVEAGIQSSFDKHFEKSNAQVETKSEPKRDKEVPSNPVRHPSSDLQKPQKLKVDRSDNPREIQESKAETTDSKNQSCSLEQSDEVDASDKPADKESKPLDEDTAAKSTEAEFQLLQTWTPDLSSQLEAIHLSVGGEEEKSAEVWNLNSDGYAGKLNPNSISNLNANLALNPKDVSMSDGNEAEVHLMPQNSFTQSEVSSARSMKNSSKPDALKNADELSDHGFEELNHSLESNDFFKLSSYDEKSALDLGQRESAPNFKSMVDRLFVESKMESPNSMPFMMSTESQKFVLKSDDSSPAMAVRSQLVNDLKPMISQILTHQKGGEMTLSLRPAELGLVRVEVKLDSNDVQVAIHAEQADAKRMLQSQSHELKEQLVNAGLKVNEISIHAMKADRNESSQHSFSDQNRQRQESAHQDQRAPRRESQTQFEEALRSGEGKEAA